MPKVHLPDGRIVNFPDDMPPDQITSAVAKLAQPAAPARTWTDTAVDALPTIGGAVGGLVGGIGGSVAGMGVGGVPGALGGATLGGGAGEAAKQLVNRARGVTAPATMGEAAGNIGKEGAVQGASEAAGMGIGYGLRTLGRGLYRAGALPIQQAFTKYGDLIGAGIENRVPVSKSGLEKAGRIITKRTGDKAAAVAEADTRAMFRTPAVVDKALAGTKDFAETQRLAGLGDPTKAFQARADRIVAENGPGMLPSQLERVKGGIDDVSGGAFKKLRMREPLSPTERMNVDLTSAMGQAQETVIPGYKDMNKGIMDAVGLKKMIARRTLGTGGNQGLENAMLLAGGPAAIPARLAMLPPVSSRLGIASHMAGEHPQASANAVRAALLAMMSAREPGQ